MATITGTNGDNNIHGTNNADLIFGLGGNDDIDGKKGNDEIYGGTGNDTVHGGDDNDTIYGEEGHDALYGERGNDDLTGGAGFDFIDGGSEFDTARYFGSIHEYTFTPFSGGFFVSHNGGAGADGTDFVIRVERLVFADAVIDTGVNNAPIAQDDSASTDEDVGTYSSGSASVTDNDFDFENSTLTVTPGTFNGTYGTLVLNADGTYSYTPFASNQSLAQGQSVQDSFSYTVSDGSLTDTGTLTITIAGINDAPVANADTASTSENSSVTVNVGANDTDVDNGAVLTVVSASAPSGQGTATVLPGNQVQFDPGTDFDYLDTGESAQVAVSYTIEDEHGAQSSSTVTVTVNGLNDAPVANDDTASTNEDDSVSGNVLANDTDADGETLTVTNPATYIGAYGTLVLAANGSYTYTPGGAAQTLNEGQSVNDVFNYTASDGTVSDSATLTITVTGTGGVPDANDDTASTTEDASVSGNVLTNDTDDEGDPLTVANPGTYTGTYGTLTLAANGSYTYTPNAFADGIAAGETAQDVFSYTATDGTGSDTATLTVTVNGLNDAPTIDGGGTDADGSVTELPDGDPNEGIATHTDSGTVAFDDLDLSDTHSASFTPQGGGYFGTFTIDPVDQTSDSVGWDFSVSDAALENLSEGEVRTQTYTVEIDDGHGGTVTQDVTITLTGAGVGTGPQTVWYIDNSAVGSANLGTQADPYTSIAAFNAAQGMLGGPQVGHTVFLLAGTGTYAEADGINLLGDQTLIGVADGALRPTIVTTGGANHGIELAQDNNISGVDIGTTTGAGISDGGGTVGVLVIGDVGVGGVRAGQIVDIDQGGLITVQLNDAASTASTGGAIDLAGVAGDFTVSGATTIAGLHGGGGVDVTGSSAIVSLTGGGLISTGAATAINYAGNTGALVLGGGLDIVTTTGIGINATGGGSISVTGSGNSITAVGGIALTVSGTTIGGSGLTFESISANGGVNGIVLSNTGAAGGLNVTGDGGGANNGSGGTIQNMTGDGILLTNTEDFRIAYMDIQNNGDNGIGGSGINGFVLDRVNISGNGNSTATDDAGIDIVGLAGSASGGSRPTSITNSMISNNYEFEIQISNTSGTLTNFQVIGTTISSNGATGAHGNLFNFLSQGTASMGLTVSGSTFDGNTVTGALTGTALHADASGGTIIADIGTSDFIDNSVAVNMSMTLGGTLTFDIHDNGLTGNLSNAINVFSGSGATGTMNGTVQDNVVGTSGVAGSGSALGRGIQVTTSGGGTANLLIDDNIVQNVAQFEGISIVDNLTAGTTNVTITDNIIRDIPAARGLNVQSAGTGNTINASISGNQFINVTGPGDPNMTVLRVNEGLGSILNVTQLAPTAAVIANELDDANGIPNTRVSVAGTPQFGQPAPTLPSTPFLPLLAAGEAPSAAADAVSQGELDLVVAAAIDRWSAVGATEDQVAAMRAVTFEIANLTGPVLGLSGFGQITIDSDAAGFGWFVDATPGGDGEFAGSGTRLTAAAGTEAGNGIDLLTAVMHELGHQIGFGDDFNPEGHDALMFGAINPGERRLPEGMVVEADASMIPLRSTDGIDIWLTYPDTPMP